MSDWNLQSIMMNLSRNVILYMHSKIYFESMKNPRINPHIASIFTNQEYSLLLHSVANSVPFFLQLAFSNSHLLLYRFPSWSQIRSGRLTFGHVFKQAKIEQAFLLSVLHLVRFNWIKCTFMKFNFM